MPDLKKKVEAEVKKIAKEYGIKIISEKRAIIIFDSFEPKVLLFRNAKNNFRIFVEHLEYFVFKDGKSFRESVESMLSNLDEIFELQVVPCYAFPDLEQKHKERMERRAKR